MPVSLYKPARLEADVSSRPFLDTQFALADGWLTRFQILPDTGQK